MTTTTNTNPTNPTLVRIKRLTREKREREERVKIELDNFKKYLDEINENLVKLNAGSVAGVLNNIRLKINSALSAEVPAVYVKKNLSAFEEILLKVRPRNVGGYFDTDDKYTADIASMVSQNLEEILKEFENNKGGATRSRRRARKPKRKSRKTRRSSCRRVRK